MKPLSQRQQSILTFVKRSIRERGYPPSIRDIMAGCRVSSTSVAARNLNVLADKGYIRRDPGINRGIMVLRRE